MNIGGKVKVLPPFDSFDGVYEIEAIEGDTYFLVGIEGGFCSQYLEEVI